MKLLVPRAMALPMALATLCIGVAPAAAVAPAGQDEAWRNANERVAKIGGWRTYARDSLPNDTSPCAIAGPTTGETLTGAAAMTAAVAPRPWPPLSWQQAEGSSRRVAVDGDLVATASKARAAWLAAVHAEASLQLAARHYDAVDAAADLATRLHAVGNLPLAEAVHEQKARAEAAIGCLDAVHERQHARWALARHIKLDPVAAASLRLPENLPALPTALLAAPRQSELLARSNQASPGAPLALRLAELESTYRHRWAVAQRHEKEIRPLVEKLREESVLRYNGMLIGPDELLKVAREALDAERAALAALAAFWQADIALQSALMGHPESGD
ncbi:MAG: hypothetical protein IPH08_19355 [Rhodocyclaceae bacterium]|nr:hypothetical protein [Rhodocyclaceae bacterium]